MGKIDLGDFLPPEIVRLLTEGAEPEKSYATYKATPRIGKDSRPTLCFTGITIQRRHDLKVMAEAHDFRVLVTPTKSLFALVVGPTAGGGKILKAIECGTPIITEPEFLQLIEQIASQGDHLSAIESILAARKSSHDQKT